MSVSNRSFASVARAIGHGLGEYAVILVLLAIVLVLVFRLMGDQIEYAFRQVWIALQGP